MTAKSNQFFLGRLFDLKAGKLSADPLNYDPAHLTTHAIVTGMTGSGKTGLCISLLEEAALQGIPAIIVDPKGDLTNLMLHFPELKPADFEPWIDPDNARREGKTLQQLSTETADTWKKGLQEWGLGQPDLRSLSEAVDRTIYTPGSTGGIPVNILASFAAPQMDWDINQELLRDKIASIITALLTLVGMKDIDSLRSREHILLSTIIEIAWRQGKSLTLPDIIQQAQEPPFTRLGAFEVDTFFPKKDCSQLAILLNNFLASPSFQTWIEGQPLDAQELLYTKSGKPRHSIFYISHLGETERMFFVTLLFAAVEAWMRTQRGTSNLRALIYFDEILGYLPPVANPASKPIMIRMVKQARAFGVGLMLTTQNPVDVDYKALSNAGTWIVGRLQTDQDKQRLLDGLEGAAGGVARSDYDRLISSLPKRAFLYQNVHEKKPLIFHSRWAMDYLAGPLTLTQIPTLNRLAGLAPFSGSPQRVMDALGTTGTASFASYSEKTYGAAGKPQLPADIEEYFLPAQSITGKSTYHPALLGQAEVNYYSRNPNFNYSRTVTVLIPDPGSSYLSWEDYQTKSVDLKSLSNSPQSSAQFSALQSHLKEPRWWSDKTKDFENWIYETGAILVRFNKDVDVTAGPEVSLEQFKEMCRQALSKKITSGSDLNNKRAALQRKIDQAQLKVNEYETELKQRILDEGVRGGKVLIDLVLKGRLGSLNPSVNKRRMTAKTQARLDAAKKNLLDLQQQMAVLQGGSNKSQNQLIEKYQEIKIAPSKRDIVIKAFGLGWKAE